MGQTDIKSDKNVESRGMLSESGYLMINSFELNNFVFELIKYKSKLNNFNAEFNNLKIELSEITTIH